MRVIPIPKPVARPVAIPPSKCGTCAYRTPSMSEELEMMICYYVERPEAHPCHEREGFYCAGAHEQVTYLEQLVSQKIKETQL